MENFVYWGRDGGFFFEAHEGAIQITVAEWQSLLKGQAEGYDIKTVKGKPTLVTPEVDEEFSIKLEISEAQTYLDETDYMVIRSAEKGENFSACYPEISKKRQLCRGIINEKRKLLTK